MKISKKQQAAIALGAAAVITVGGTFAWFSTSDKVENVFDMDDFDVSISESFDPEVPVTPGATITKQVGVTNYGNVPVYVRMRFEETLTLQHFETKPDVYNRLLVYSTVKDSPSSFTNEDGSEYTLDGQKKAIKAVYDQKVIETITKSGSGWSKVESATITGPASGTETIEIYCRTSTASVGNGNTVTQYFSYDTADNHIVYVTKTDDGKYAARYAFHIKSEADTVTKGIHAKTRDPKKDIDHTNITLNFDGTEKENWTLDTDADDNEGYYYYEKVLNAGESTGNLLDSVTFAEDMPNDYLGAVYTITPYMEAVQANKKAVDAEWDMHTDPDGKDYNVEVSGDSTLIWTISNTYQ